MYALEFKSSVKKDLKKVELSDIKFIKASLFTFVENFSHQYKQDLLQKGKIKKLQAQDEELFRLKLRRYSVIYKKENTKLIILVLSIKSRENAYQK
jgi:mRNA interferase RelE/StbE